MQVQAHPQCVGDTAGAPMAFRPWLLRGCTTRGVHAGHHWIFFQDYQQKGVRSTDGWHAMGLNSVHWALRHWALEGTIMAVEG